MLSDPFTRKFDYSIIVPCFNHLDFTRNCIESILQFSKSYDYELIIVSNGSDDGTVEYIYGLQKTNLNILLVHCPLPLGATAAINLGWRVSKGDYLITLNNDVQILGDSWIDMLKFPFLMDTSVGITGPLKLYSSILKCFFIVFFCAMISRKFYEDVGELREEFGWGAGEDTLLAKLGIFRGWKIVMVPNDEKPAERSGDYMTGNFPIFHGGEATVNDLPDWDKIIERNGKTLERIQKDEFGGNFER